MSRIKTPENEYIAQCNVIFANVSPGMLAQAGITTTSWDATNDLFNAFVLSKNSADTARAQARSAVAAKDDAKAASRAPLQQAVDKFYATPSITNEQLEAVGLPPRNSGGSSSAPRTVTNLSATPSPSGTCTLRWRRNGNTDRTLFEVQVFDGVSWDLLNSTNKTAFKDTGAVPGVSRTYRVVSVNQRGRSEPSLEVTIYAGEGGGSLRVAA